jgi:acyl-CoA synthetase (AMP-forming)/AMP-acid ligase II
MLAAVVREAAGRFGDAPALVAAEGWRVSYRDLDRFSDEAAAGLARAGVLTGDVVALVMPSGPEYVVAYVALAKLGAVTVGVNPRLAAPERARALEAVGPAVVLVTPELMEGVPAGIARLPVDVSEGGAILSGIRLQGRVPPPVMHDPSRPVAIVLTSGTTGRPKGAVFTGRHIEMIAAIDTAGRTPQPGPILASTEFAHVGFMTKLALHLREGARTHMLRRWRAADALRVIAEQRMSYVGAISTQIALMLRESNFEEYDLSAVKAVVGGGGPSPPALIREARERFHAPYSVRYSLTESGGIGCATAFDAPEEEALSTVGRPRDGVSVEVRDDDLNPLPAGEVGDVWMRSAAVMESYWNDPASTAEVLQKGWLRTGDLGLIDDRGCLRLAGRRKEMFIRGGYNVYPMEVEAVLASHPLVRDVAVVPRPDAVMGEIGVAVVVPAEAGNPPTLEALRAYAKDRLAGYKLPEAIRLVEALPRTAMEKIDRRALGRSETENLR